MPRLIIHLTACGHECGPSAGTTITSDGRVIWPGEMGRPLDARLTSAGLQRVQDELDGIDALRTSGTFSAKLRPGADPPGHGTNSYRFELDRDGERVVVDTTDPGSFEPEFWIISREMKVLGELAHRLQDPVAWLGSETFAEVARPYAADRFLMLAIVSSGDGIPAGYPTDADDVAWPFDGPIESAGVHVDIGLVNQEARCVILDAPSFDRLLAAELAAGATRDLRGWISGVGYRWVRGNGSVEVQTTPLLPHETGLCLELLTGTQ